MLHVLRTTLSPTMKMIKNSMKSFYLSRTLTTSKRLANNYEGDGKTTVSILNSEYKHLIMIDTFSNYGFRLNNGIFAIGPLAVFPRSILQWNVNSIAEMTIESLSLFCLLEPKIDILVIGTGHKGILPNKKILEHLKSKKITAEILPTQHACSIFNFLNAEGRCIAGAFIPPTYVQLYEDEQRIMDNVEAMDHYDPSLIKDSKIRE